MNDMRATYARMGERAFLEQQIWMFLRLMGRKPELSDIRRFWPTIKAYGDRIRSIPLH